MTPKIPLPADPTLPEDIRARLAELPPLNVFRMFANAPASFHQLLAFAFSILFESELDPRKREMAILRVAQATGSKYEWTQHVALARGTGVSEREIAVIGSEGTVTNLDEEGNLLCRVADEISRDVRLSDEALAAILDRYGTRQATELILCCAYFNMLSRFLESARVELEETDVLGSTNTAASVLATGKHEG